MISALTVHPSNDMVSNTTCWKCVTCIPVTRNNLTTSLLYFYHVFIFRHKIGKELGEQIFCVISFLPCQAKCGIFPALGESDRKEPQRDVHPSGTGRQLLSLKNRHAKVP